MSETTLVHHDRDRHHSTFNELELSYNQKEREREYFSLRLIVFAKRSLQANHLKLANKEYSNQEVSRLPANSFVLFARFTNLIIIIIDGELARFIVFIHLS